VASVSETCAADVGKCVGAVVFYESPVAKINVLKASVTSPTANKSFIHAVADCAVRQKFLGEGLVVDGIHTQYRGS